MHNMIVNNLGLIEAAMTFVIVIGFCAYQYWSVSRSQAEDRAAAKRSCDEDSSALDAQGGTSRI